MSNDLIERLEVWARSEFGQSGAGSMFAEAAAELRTLRAERDAAVQAEVAAMNELNACKDALAQVGEFICRKCGLRQAGNLHRETFDMSEVTVTQEDREAAAAFVRDDRTGLAIKFSINASLQALLEAFARHRTAAHAAGLAEGVALGIEAAAKWAKDDAKTCDCSAYSESECACGAWCQWKTVPMHRVIEALSALSPAAIIAAQGGE